MSSVRVGTRPDDTTYTQILFRAFDPDKGRKVQTSESFEDHDEALRWQEVLDSVGPEEARATLGRRRRVGASTGVSLVGWLQTYIEGLRGVGEGTIKKYRGYIENSIEPYFTASLPLTALCAHGPGRVSMVQEWVLHMDETDAAAKTIANKHGFLSGALKAATKHRPPLLPFNPCDDTQLPERDYTPAFLSTDEFAVLYAMTPDRWKPQVLFRVATGARPSEITAATVGDIDQCIDADGISRVTFRITKAWEYTGSNKDKHLRTAESSADERTIGVPEEAVALLDLDRPKTELLFPVGSGEPVTAQLFYKDCWTRVFLALADLLDRRPPDVLAELVLSLGMSEEQILAVAADLVNKRPRPYDLRHTCAGWMMIHGAELADVQQHLGHASVRTTENMYGHLGR